MRTLEDLKKYITLIPCRFNGENTTGETPTFAPTAAAAATGRASYEKGFPANVATSGGKSIDRADGNILGQLATNELLYKMAGGYHTYLKKASSYIGGYPKSALLGYYDGESIVEIESNVPNNRNDFTQDEWLIGNYIQSGDTIYKPWERRTHVYGLDEGYITVGDVDFSVRNEIHKGDTLDDDSLIVISCGQYPVTEQADVLFPTDAITLGNLTVTVVVNYKNNNYTFNLPNKGKCGSIAELLYLSLVPQIYYQYLKQFCGSANYCVSFYAPKGSKIVSAKYDNGCRGWTEPPTGDVDVIYAYGLKKGIHYPV